MSRDTLAAAPRLTFLHTGFDAGPVVYTDGAGSLLEERRYEPFGEPIDARTQTPTGYMVGNPDVVTRDLNALNKRTEAATGWSDHGARWMAPETGRWLTPDPPVEGPDAKFMFAPWALHPYQYVNQNPVAYWDPDGRSPDSIWNSGQELARQVAAAGIPGRVAAGAILIGAALGAGLVGLVKLGEAVSERSPEIAQCGGDAECAGFMTMGKLYSAERDRAAAQAQARQGVRAEEKGSKPSQFAVRLQAQGGGLEESVPINQDTPVTVAQGLAGLEVLGAKLSAKDQQLRAGPFERAARFIVNAGKAGGVGAPGKSFPVQPGNPIRVDVEVLRGVNFKN